MKKAFVLLAVVFTVTISPMQTMLVYEGNDIVQDNGSTGMQRADVVLRNCRDRPT